MEYQQKSLNLRELIDELWALYFVFIKGLWLSATSLLYMFALLMYTTAQWFFVGSKRLYVKAQDWKPVRPVIFNIE